MHAVTAREEAGWKLTLKAAIIYDEFDFAARAAAMLEQVTVQADEAVQWEVTPWRLDFLRVPALAGFALGETADADLMVVALSRTHRPPDDLLDWLEGWAKRRRHREAALMVWCPEETAGPASAWTRLNDFAAWHGLALLGNHGLPDEGNSANQVREWWRRAPPLRSVSPARDDPPDSPRPWGLNE